MIALRRPVLPAAVLAVVFALPASGQVDETFEEGVDLLRRGQNEEALVAFQRVLALDPSHADAYQLWQTTEHEIWLKLLTLEGEYELVGKRLIDLAAMGRRERRNDPDAIRALVIELDTDDVIARTRATRTLAAAHGEYAVPVMVHALGDESDADRRVIVMQALTQMGSDVVLPLVAALDAPDAFMRRNVALTLGYITDPRANAALSALATTDPEQSVRGAAAEALERCGGSTDAAGQYLSLGDAYYVESDTVLMPHQVSDVVWNWVDGGLVSTSVPSFLYAPEMARRAYYDALAVDAGSTRALAGIARSTVTATSRIGQWAALGQDAGEWPSMLEGDLLSVQLAGAEALDLALGWSLDQSDQVAASGLCQALALAATQPTPNLVRALTAVRSGAVRGEAAVAIGTLLVKNGGAADAETVGALTEAAARQVLQIAVVIDANAARRESFAGALAERGVHVNAWSNGVRGLTSLRAVPGVDVILVADQLPDLTIYQVVDAIRRDPRLASTPILVIPSDAAADDSLYGGKVNGIVTSVAAMEALDQALEASMNPERELANDLAVRAAGTLQSLSLTGSDLSASADALAGTLADRPDGVVAPALGALAAMGGSAHVLAITAVLTDVERSEEVRTRAADALGAIFSRTGSSDGATVEALRTVATADGSLALRTAIARALGRLNLSKEMRAELIKGVHSK